MQRHVNASLYCQLMEYIKWRTEAIDKTVELVRTKKHYLDNRAAAELCLLQLRYCCELLAIGCIAIHTDVPQANRLHKMWNAEQIMKAFEDMKPTFFPTGVKSIKREDGIWDQVDADGALTKAELTRMYNLFGELLHTGTFKRYKNQTEVRYDFRIITDFLAKLRNLLNDHTYLLHDNQKMIRVIMQDVKDGRVKLNELDAMPIGSEPSKSDR